MRYYFFAPGFLLMITTIFSSCSEKKDDGPEPVVPPPVKPKVIAIDTCMHPFLFDKNSYWVYRETDSLILDSVYIFQFQSDTRTAGNSGGSRPTEIAYCSMVFFNKSGYVGNWEVTEDYMNPGLGHNYPLYWCDGSDASWSASDRKATRVEEIETLTILGQQYEDVIAMQRRITYDTLPDRTEVSYFAPHVGIVRRNLQYDNGKKERWDLLRYNVISATP